MAKKKGDGDRASGISISGGVGAMPVLDTVITGDRTWEPGHPHYSVNEDGMGEMGYGNSFRR
jgi:AGZA family xanthine/uracil permease-like MFS transporter